MNTTAIHDTSASSYQISTMVFMTLFLLSEILPFIKKHKGNGCLDTLVCVLHGSSCMTERLANAIEASEAKKDDNA